MDNKQNYDFRKALSTFPTGVTIVTTINKQNKPIGFTANSFTSVSFKPHLILICIDKASFYIETFKNNKYFAVNVLSKNQHWLSTTFAKHVKDRFLAVDWHTHKTGCPIINKSVSWFDCIKHDFIVAGDHIIIVGRVLEFDHTAHTPLVFLHSNYINLSLGQKMLHAVEDNTTQVLVGMLVEHSSGILLLKHADGFLQLPTASKLGFINEKNSLLGKLKQIGITIDEYYIFSVFESTNGNTNFIYYRTYISDDVKVSRGKFYALDDIPFANITNKCSKIMLKRYTAEKAVNNFGIYVGKDSGGKIEATIK